VHETTGANAIIVVPGAAAELCAADVDAAAEAIRASRVFVTQLEQPVDAARCGLEIAVRPASPPSSIRRPPAPSTVNKRPKVTPPLLG
jgi:sugar/nucleoside kinase (ribokinase family)